MQWLGFELSADNRRSLQVPKGCTNAFLTLEDNTLVHYYVSDFYHPASERGFRFNDPAFAVEWPFAPSQISDKDLGYPDFAAEILNAVDPG